MYEPQDQIMDLSIRNFLNPSITIKCKDFLNITYFFGFVSVDSHFVKFHPHVFRFYDFYHDLVDDQRRDHFSHYCMEAACPMPEPITNYGLGEL